MNKTRAQVGEFFSNLNEDELKQAIWKRVTHQDIEELGDIPVDRDGYYADMILYSSCSEQARSSDLLCRVQKACVSILRDLLALTPDRFYDGPIQGCSRHPSHP